MKKRYIYIFISLIVIICSGYYYYRHEVYPYNWEEAEKNFQLYIKAQHVDKNNIESIKKIKQTKVGGIAYDVIYKDDKDLTYEYIYSRNYEDSPYNISLIIYNKLGDGIGDTAPHKYPDLEEKENIK